MIRFHGTVTARAPITVNYKDHDGLPRSPHGEAVLHGGTFRGPLRKAAYRALRGRLARLRSIDESQVFTLADAYMLGQGVDTSRAVNNESTTHADPIADARLRKINPMLSLFGRWKLPSRLSVGEMRTPEANVMTAGVGARADMFERDTTEVEYLSDEDRDLLLHQLDSERASHAAIDKLRAEVKSHQRERARATKEDRAKHSEAIKSLEARIKEHKNEREGAEESVKHPLAGFEAIAAGSELSHTLTLINGTPTDLGLTLLALGELARNPFLGGHRNTGCGEFEAHWDILQWPAGQLQPETIGSVSISPDGLSIDGSVPQDALDGFVGDLKDFDFSVHTLEQARAR